LLFIGHCLLGFTEKEVGRMTLKKLMKLYGHYKNQYDFTVTRKQYRELEEIEEDFTAEDGEYYY